MSRACEQSATAHCVSTARARASSDQNTGPVTVSNEPGYTSSEQPANKDKTHEQSNTIRIRLQILMREAHYEAHPDDCRAGRARRSGGRSRCPGPPYSALYDNSHITKHKREETKKDKPASNVTSELPGPKTSDSWKVILPGMSMSNKCICTSFEQRVRNLKEVLDRHLERSSWDIGE